MVTSLTTPADPPSGSPVRPRGVLAVASPAPEGWEAGGLQVSAVCPTPIIRDKCITLAGGDEPGSPTQNTFPAFMIEQGSGCSTLSLSDRSSEASTALNDSTDYALGLTLLNGEANGGAPSLSDADEVGTGAFDGAVAALAELERAAANAGKGVAHTLHASPATATHLAAAGLIDDQGRAPSGAQWVISSGYTGEDFQIWATGRVWAAAGTISTHEAVNRPQNQREAWAVRSAIVGFNSCVNHTVTFAPTPTVNTV